MSAESSSELSSLVVSSAAFLGYYLLEDYDLDRGRTALLGKVEHSGHEELKQMAMLRQEILM